MNHIIDFFLWYLNFMLTHMHIVIPIALLGVWYEICKEIKYRRDFERWEAVMSYASTFGISYEEADKIVITDDPK